MTTYSTGNPIGSTAVQDLYDNTENLDALVNSRAVRQHEDRMGVSRKTWWGMEQDFQDFLVSSGYQNIGDYEPGLEITARNQVFWKDGELYRAGASLELPYTTSGNWEDEEPLFVAAGDQALRQDLAGSSGSNKGAALVGFEGGTVADLADKQDLTKGAAMIGRSSQVVGSIDDLRTLSKTSISTDALAAGYYVYGDGGGGSYHLDLSDTTTPDNGGTIIVANDGGRWKLSVPFAVSVRQFGAKGDGVTDDTAAFQRMIDHLVLKPGAAFIPDGTYRVTNTLDISGMNGCRISGESTEGTIIFLDSAATYLFHSPAAGDNRTFENFSVAGDGTRTGGYYFRFANDKFTFLKNVKMTGWYNAIRFDKFIQCTVADCEISDPVAGGTALLLGSKSATNTGANFNLMNSMLRGNTVNTLSAPKALYGIIVNDIEALFIVNTDLGGFATTNLRVDPQTRCANIHVTQTFFDATGTGDCMMVQGAGIKTAFSFTGSWFASAGVLDGGTEACGVRFYTGGACNDILFTGTRFYNCNGSAVLCENPSVGLNFSGCSFFANGGAATTNKYGIYVAPASAQTIGMNIEGCIFGGHAGFDVYMNANARYNMISGSKLDAGIFFGALQFSGANNADNQSFNIASAATLSIRPNKDLLNVTGATNIVNITPTYIGHRLTLIFTTALTVQDNTGNLRLNGNLVTANGTVLNLVCNGGSWVETSRLTV